MHDTVFFKNDHLRYEIIFLADGFGPAVRLDVDWRTTEANGWRGGNALPEGVGDVCTAPRKGQWFVVIG